METLPLFRRFPGIAGRIPHLPLTTLPTPVERLAIGDAPLWVKRDDRTGEAYGGNKVRKLEFLLGEARQQGADRLVTAGAAGSHHCLATTVYGREHGFDLTLVLFSQPPTPHVREVLGAVAARGAEIRPVPRMELVPAGLLRERLRHRRSGCVVIPPGGSSPAGTLGYVSAGLELAEQVEAGDMPAPDVVHVAAGTLGTAVGLAIGLEMAGLPARVHAVRVVGRLVANPRAVRGLVRRTLQRLAEAGAAAPDAGAVQARIDLSSSHLGAGYGVATPAGEAAIREAARSGLVLDSTYTGKVAAAALGDATSDPERVHLYWHTLSATTPAVPAGAPPLPDAALRLLGMRRAG
jgi:1-aminocyclopropane-1-carboxylate deaminase/D-cysteine desulfhydrase-like pyridoxal-dependent ACC family enzyme